jgi:hypothetical protein
VTLNPKPCTPNQFKGRVLELKVEAVETMGSPQDADHPKVLAFTGQDRLGLVRRLKISENGEGVQKKEGEMVGNFSGLKPGSIVRWANPRMGDGGIVFIEAAQDFENFQIASSDG